MEELVKLEVTGIDMCDKCMHKDVCSMVDIYKETVNMLDIIKSRPNFKLGIECRNFHQFITSRPGIF